MAPHPMSLPWYDPTQEEIKELRHALHQIGEAVLLTDEELGQEWIRYAKRVVRYEYRKFRANCGDPQSQDETK